MKIILYNASLDKEQNLVKTKDKNLYGMYNIKEDRHIVEPLYLHIYEFDEDTNTAVVINQNEKYLQIDKSGRESILPVRKVGEYQFYLAKADPCNCVNGCDLCKRTGVLFNSYGLDNNFKYIRKFDAF